MCACMHACARSRACMSLRTRAQTYACMCALLVCVYVCVRACVCVRARARVCVCVCAHARAYETWFGLVGPTVSSLEWRTDVHGVATRRHVATQRCRCSTVQPTCLPTYLSLYPATRPTMYLVVYLPSYLSTSTYLPSPLFGNVSVCASTYLQPCSDPSVLKCTRNVPMRSSPHRRAERTSDGARAYLPMSIRRRRGRTAAATRLPPGP